MVRKERRVRRHMRSHVRWRRRLELARVGVVRGVFELAVRAQVVGARVGGAAQRALEAAREVHVVVVADVRHHLAAQLAAVQVERAGHALERQPHVPALRACNQPCQSHHSPCSLAASRLADTYSDTMATIYDLHSPTIPSI